MLANSFSDSATFSQPKLTWTRSPEVIDTARPTREGDVSIPGSSPKDVLPTSSSIESAASRTSKVAVRSVRANRGIHGWRKRRWCLPSAVPVAGYPVRAF